MQRWCRSSVRQILTNPDYTGDKILQKTFRDDPITKHRRINRGEKTKFIVHDNHEAIITREEFELCQKIRKEREEKRGEYTPRFKIHPMAKLIKCGNCGKNYRNKIRNKKEVWVCEKYLSECETVVESLETSGDLYQKNYRKDGKGGESGKSDGKYFGVL